ncbi:jupiter microtubule associated homolog 1b [Electrophorus electricus]|uniref:jupiter microtubule associated homolog 1b n=1 Tax=Electrophorus electricus TaxID=8005 RepID=UPI0015D09CDA|nr:jupiter microtubule associated homolog 1b [Electrophorus electricus]
MTTTTTFQGMDPSAKNSSRVLRPPGGASNICFGTDEDKPARKNRMASNIFAEPDDPHAHRRNNPPGGEASGVLCGEHSAPLRRCHQPPIFLNDSASTEHQSNPVIENQEPESYDQSEEVEVSEEQQKDEQASGAASGRRNPPGGKSSLILG